MNSIHIRRFALLAGLLCLVGTTPLTAAPPVRSTYYDGFNGTISAYPAGEGVVNSLVMTVEAWVRREDAARCETVVGRNWQSSFWLGFCSNGLRFYRSGGSYADADLNVSADAWTHVAAVYDGAQVQFYIDGQPAGTKPLSNSGATNPDHLSTGGDVTGYPFLGYIDEVRVWSSARSAGEIQGNLYLEASGNEAGLVFRSATGGLAGAQGRVQGILPRALLIPEASGPMVVEGDVNLNTEYVGAEQLVIRYRNGSGVADAVAHLVYRDVNGDRNLYVGVTGIRDVGPNWTRAQSFVTLNIDPDHSQGSVPATTDFRMRGFLDAAPGVWEWGNGANGFTGNINPPAPTLWKIAYSYHCSGEFSPPCMEFQIAAGLVNDLQGTIGLSMLHNWVFAQANDYPAPGNAGWNNPATWAGATFDHPVSLPAISGRITDNNQQALAGVAVLLTGDHSGAVITDGKGEYRFEGLGAGGDFKVFPYFEGYDFSPIEKSFLSLTQPEVADFVGTFDPQWQLPEIDLPAVSSGITLTLNQALYEPGESLTAVLDLGAYSSPKDELPAVLVALPGGDVEVLSLLKIDPNRYQVFEPTAVESSGGGAATRFDGKLTVAPGDKVVAIWYVTDLNPGGPAVEEDMIYDHALTLDPEFPDSPNTIVPELALSDDELSPPPGGKPLATLLGRGGFPVQVPSNELIVYPRDEDDLNRFLAFANGTVLATNDDPQNEPDAKSLPAVLVQVDPSSMDLRYLPQLRDLFGHPGELFSSNDGGLQILQLALLSQMEGYIVALNPRLQFADAPMVSEQGAGTMMANMNRHAQGILNVPEVWSFMSLFDFDEARIPMAIMDVGFSPNPDYRGFDEDSIQGCALNGLIMDCSPDAAFGIPTVGNSLFGEKSWHGNGVVAVAGGVLNNGWGIAGVGGQVVVPVPYKYDLANYAFGIGRGIRHATLGGVSVINLSAGYPCVLRTELGGFNICDPGSRAAFCAAVTASVATAAGVACAATSAFLPFLAPLVCTAATAATVAAGEACIALVAAGDVREPMRSAIQFASERGVPVVTIAGNNINFDNLPDIARDLIDGEDRRVESWEIYPAMVPEVIVVGATSSAWPFGNIHFFGDRVDLWAPIRGAYFAPVDATAVRPYTEHVLHTGDSGERRGIGGTSAAAPYVAGVIATMQAANPNLNRNTPGLSDLQRRSIVNQIKNLLRISAWTVPELVDRAPDAPTADAVMAGLGERHNLVNPLRALRLATIGIVPAFESMGYETSLGFSEDDPDFRQDTEASAEMVGIGETFSAGIYSHPGERRTADWHDVDWYGYSIPASPSGGPGLYRMEFELRTPRGFGAPMIFPRGYSLYLDRHTAIENIYNLVGPSFPNGVDGSILFRMHGAGIEDYLYQLSGSALVRTGDLPRADRFDVNNPAVNPPESRPDNDLRNRSVHLGEPGEFVWRLQRSTTFDDHWTMRLPDLSIHEVGDEDWFVINDFPPFTIGDSPACNPYMEVVFGDDMQLLCVRQDGTIVLSNQDSPATVPTFALLEDQLFFKLYPLPHRVPEYDLEFRFFTTNPRICAIEAALGGARAAGEARGSGEIGFPGALPEIMGFGPGDYASLPRRDFDQMGRVTTPDAYLIHWSKSGAFSAAFDLLAGDSLMLRLVDAAGMVMAESHTSNLENVHQPQLNDDAPAPTTGTSLRLNVANLPEGDYLLLVSHAYLGTRINMLLPQGAITDGSPSIESVMAGPQPEPPTMEITKNAGDLTLSWPDGFFDFQLQTRGGLNGGVHWEAADEEPLAGEGVKSVVVDPAGDQKYFRLRYLPENQ